MQQDLPKQIIGRVEKTSFPEVGIGELYARVDTGAQTSAIWASKAELESGRLAVVFLGPGHPEYTGEVYYFDDFTQTTVISSNGHSETRYKIRTLVCIGNRKIRARLTLADRSTQTYPVLIGRNVLRGKFIVDVKISVPLAKAKKIVHASRRKDSRLI